MLRVKMANSNTEVRDAISSMLPFLADNIEQTCRAAAVKSLFLFRMSEHSAEVIEQLEQAGLVSRFDALCQDPANLFSQPNVLDYATTFRDLSLKGPVAATHLVNAR